MTDQALIIPPEHLSADALNGVIEAFIAREGTDYGEVELSFAEKIEQVRKQLQRGDAVVVFDVITESCTLMTLQGWRDFQWLAAQSGGEES